MCSSDPDDEKRAQQAEIENDKKMEDDIYDDNDERRAQAEIENDKKMEDDIYDEMWRERSSDVLTVEDYDNQRWSRWDIPTDDEPNPDPTLNYSEPDPPSDWSPNDKHDNYK